MGTYCFEAGPILAMIFLLLFKNSEKSSKRTFQPHTVMKTVSLHWEQQCSALLRAVANSFSQNEILQVRGWEKKKKKEKQKQTKKSNHLKPGLKVI